MTDREMFIAAFSKLHASPDTIEEVLKMTKEKKVYPVFTKQLVIAAIAVCLVLALGVTAYGAGKSIFSWGNNAEVWVTEDEAGVSREMMLHTENLTEPVVIKDGKMIFIVNNENIDITDQISQTEAFIYDYEDSEGITHYILVGLNGDVIENFGYGEFMKDSSGWIGGYSARTNTDANGDGTAWLENGKAELNIPW